MADKVTEALVDALKVCLAEPGEQRFFRSGKLPGLFAGRSGVNGEAATRALQEGLIEVARTEVKGKTAVEWVRLTPRGVDFLHQHESPIRLLEELREVLRVNQDAVPAWLAKAQQDLWNFGSALNDNVQRLTQRLEALSERLEDTLRRADAGGRPLPNGLAAGLPWAVDALAYLDRRRSSNGTGDCPLPELFAALREQHADLSITSFHEGLRRLYDRSALRLLPFDGLPETLPEPEYALLDGGDLLYYVTR